MLLRNIQLYPVQGEMFREKWTCSLKSDLFRNKSVVPGQKENECEAGRKGGLSILWTTTTTAVITSDLFQLVCYVREIKLIDA